MAYETGTCEILRQIIIIRMFADPLVIAVCVKVNRRFIHL